MRVEDLISVVIPSFGTGTELLRAIQSVISQTHQNFEVWIVDDCSAVHVQELIFCNFNDTRLNVVRHDINRGAAAARNTGLKLARGAYIAFLDDDDEWAQDKLSLQLAFLKEDSRRKLTSTAFVLRRVGSADQIRRFPPLVAKADLLYGCGVSPGSTLLMSRSAVDEIGYLDSNLRRLEDWDWLLRASSIYDLHVLDRPLTIVNVKEKDLHFDVAAATRVILTKRYEYGLRSNGEHLLLRSSLYHEAAASAYNSGKLMVAAGKMLLSFVLGPFKSRSSYARMISRVWKDIRSVSRSDP